MANQNMLLTWLTDLSDNWKVVVAGVALLGVTIAFLMGKLTSQQYMEVIATLAGLGFIAAATTPGPRTGPPDPPTTPTTGPQTR